MLYINFFCDDNQEVLLGHREVEVRRRVEVEVVAATTKLVESK